MEHDLQLPVQTVEGEIDWKRPTYQTVYQMLTNPVYGGAYAYGKTEHVTEYENGEPRRRCHQKPRQRWLVLIPGTHSGYVSWEQFQQVQLAIGDNRQSEAQSDSARNIGKSPAPTESWTTISLAREVRSTEEKGAQRLRNEIIQTEMASRTVRGRIAPLSLSLSRSSAGR
jgi:hypothetical protein